MIGVLERRRRSVFVASLAVAATAFALLAAPNAMAGHVNCGDTISASTTLDSDLANCPNDGVVIGAPGITLNLAGHSIDGSGSNPGGQGVDNSAGHDNVVVRAGRITDFFDSVLLRNASHNTLSYLDTAGGGFRLEDASDNLLDHVSLFGAGLSIINDSDRNRLQRSSITGAGAGVSIIPNNIGFFPTPDRNVLDGNSLRANGYGVVAISNTYTTLIRNDISGNAGFGVLVALSGGVVMDRNSVTGNNVGVDVSGLSQLTSLLRNDFSGNSSDGVLVEEGTTKTTIDRNTANGNGDDGIDVDSVSTTLSRNLANANGNLGIEAVAGVTDGGANKARGNGDPRQCTNVSCT